MTASRVPDFLIIGAMKSGTTTLYDDLETQDGVFLPENKEPNLLTRAQLSDDQLRTRYGELFVEARPDQICGDGSTHYSQSPSFPGVPERALGLLGNAFRVIYMVRNPIARTISHHHHMMSVGEITGDIDEAVRLDERLVQYSRYGMQLQPWLEAVGPDRVRVVVFEEYVEDRVGTIHRLADFLGFAFQADRIDTERVSNASTGKQVPRGIWHHVSQSDLYLRFVRPLVPSDLRRRVTGLFKATAPPRPAPPSRATVDWLLEQFSEDADLLARQIGRPGPIWDWEATRARYLEALEAEAASTGASSEPITPS